MTGTDAAATPSPRCQLPDPGTRGIDAQPDDTYFDVMASVAETHWWYRYRRALVAQVLANRIPAGATVLDIGCGTAEGLDVLEGLGAGAAIGTDLAEPALAHAARRRSRPKILRALAEALPFRSGAAAALVSLDVIEHLDDDVAGLREYVRVCRPGSPVVLTVPAYRWLWGEHDDRAFHRRRYTAPMLVRAATEAGIRVEWVSYFFAFLLPPAVLARKTPLRRLLAATDEEATADGPLGAIFDWLGRLERRVLRLTRLPFGLSIILVGRTPVGRAGG